MNWISPLMESEISGRDLHQLIHSIAGMGEENRIVLSLYYLEGLSGPEIAQVLCTSEEVFHVFFADAMNALRAHLRALPEQQAA